MIAPARVAVLEILRTVSSGRADLPTAIDASRDRLPDARDRALAAEIATGTLRHRGTIDFLIAHFAARPLRQLDADVLEILRLSVYQLLHLTRVPAAAVVDDAVKLTRRVRKSSAAGLVNAVLRALSRHRRALPLPPRPTTGGDRQAALAYLCTTLSHPPWLVERWLDRLGFERSEAWLAFNNGPAPLTLRVNRRVTTRDELQATLMHAGVRTTAGRFAPDALLVESPYDRSALVAQAGAFVFQDEASQLVPLLAGSGPLARVLDTCASPGGKSTALATTAAASGLVVACDVRDRRIGLLRQTVAASGCANVRIVQADFRETPPFRGAFDCVLVDAPCSGLGVLRREPDLKWRRQPDDLDLLAATQLQLLRHAAALVRPGGRLFYATCSSEPLENELVGRRFLVDTPGFRHVPAGDCHPVLDAALIDADGNLRTEPDRHGLEAFFGMVFERGPAAGPLGQL